MLTNISVNSRPGSHCSTWTHRPATSRTSSTSPLLCSLDTPDSRSPIAGTLTIRGQTGTGPWEDDPTSPCAERFAAVARYARDALGRATDRGLMNSDLALAGQIPAETRASSTSARPTASCHLHLVRRRRQTALKRSTAGRSWCVPVALPEPDLLGRYLKHPAGTDRRRPRTQSIR